MAYTINKYDRTELVVLDDGTLDTTTSLGLVGRNYVGYGEIQNENFVFLLENFANANPPTRPLKGQLWYNTQDRLTYVYNGIAWDVIGSAVLSDTAPEDPHVGGLWFKTPINTLYIFNGTDWTFIGPESAENFGVTRARTTTILDSDSIERPVIFLTVNDTVIGICSSMSFIINSTTPVPGFSQLVAGITLSSLTSIKGSLNGNASSADRLLVSRSINNVAFDGTENITIKSSTTNKLEKGTYLVGSDFDGSVQTTWSVDATPSNVIGKVVARNSEGGFSAGTIAASLIGNVTGNVTSTSGISSFDVVTANRFIGASLSGNAFSATKLETSRKINGVDFDGTFDITVAASANTLTGTTIKNTVVSSNLQTLGTLLRLDVADEGIVVGSGNQIVIAVEAGTSTIRSISSKLAIDVGGVTGPEISFINAATSVDLGGPSTPAMIGDNVSNIGMVGHKFDKVFANEFKGNADTTTLATTTINIQGGGQGSIPYQSANGVTTMLPVGANNYVLKSKTGNALAWEPIAFERLTEGSYIKFTNTSTTGDVSYYDTVTPVTVAVEASSTNTANKLVARDSSGNFNASMITSNVTLLSEPTSAMHAVTKQYADAAVPAGAIIMWSGSVSNIPARWTLCNGSNGTPDLRNRFVVGAGSTYNPGDTGGSRDSVVPSHTHSVADPGHKHVLLGGPGSFPDWYGGSGADYGSGFGTPYDPNCTVDTATTGIVINSAGVSGINANLPPYYALCYIMKL